MPIRQPEDRPIAVIFCRTRRSRAPSAYVIVTKVTEVLTPLWVKVAVANPERASAACLKSALVMRTGGVWLATVVKPEVSR